MMLKNNAKKFSFNHTNHNCHMSHVSARGHCRNQVVRQVPQILGTPHKIHLCVVVQVGDLVYVAVFQAIIKMWF